MDTVTLYIKHANHFTSFVLLQAFFTRLVNCIEELGTLLNSSNPSILQLS
ncbi:hypothetical protein SLEP1_g50420 [Rubroshorea leprosula]|uniref:Uncharacterized protein n=1 Tax=Rubroshorea leprosula TaxID=152421 RepID=A0AAV5M0V1_9ROSI|nr:hypothetical protein SLEP1_g50420 [Rubroshorea leprosula]